jgi:tRNA dimethylallyltransferase
MIAVVGPTATGKTDVGVLLAERVGGEIVSADSMQIWRGMDIGTAKPDAALRARVPFHLIDVAGIHETFSVARFQRLALEAMRDILSRGRVPLLVGGTGLYIRAVVDGLRMPPPADPAVRARLQEEVAHLGSPALHERLVRIDPQSAGRISPNDAKRIVRALEVFETTGRTLTEWNEQDRARRSDTPWLQFGLHCERDELNRRIEARVDAMLRAGWVDEVRSLMEAGLHPGLQSACALGYQEIMRLLTEGGSLEETAQAIKIATRQFAKRQRTWFRADPRIIWVDVTGRGPEEAAEEILRLLSQPALRQRNKPRS